MGDARPRSGPPRATVRRWRRMLADERAEASVYRELAKRRGGEEREILLGLAEAEARHAAHWVRLLGEDLGRPRRGSLRMRTLAFLARRFGWLFILALMQHAEARWRYASDSDAPQTMVADERIHAEVVRGLAARGRARLSGTLRAAVFGANDGLVSNLALVLGVFGGGGSARTVLLAGLSGLLAGALSMAAGEYVSVSSQRELLAATLPGKGVTASVSGLDLNANELALVYRARGMPASDAEDRADEVLRRQHDDLAPIGPATAGPGLEPGTDVIGSGLGAALSSFVFFAAGALIPVLPFLFGLDGGTAIVVAAALTGTGLLLAGGTVGMLSGAPPLRRGLRQLVIGAGAAIVTYVLGLAFGSVIG